MYCGDSGCFFGSKEDKKGMHTNGGCRCLKPLESNKVMYVRRMHRLLEQAKEIVDNLPVHLHPNPYLASFLDNYKRLTEDDDSEQRRDSSG